MIKKIRTFVLKDEELEICKHLKMKGYISEHENAEYHENVEIYCKECKKWITLNILIN